MCAQLDLFAPRPQRRRRRRRFVTRFIHRLEIANERPQPSRGWQVRLRPFRISAWFGDAQYGGVRRSLRAAMAFRDEQLQLHSRTNG